MVDHPRSTISQMRACLSTLAMISACERLHRAKAIHKRSEADLLERQLKDARDVMAALERQPGILNALMLGEQLVPANALLATASQMAEDGVPE